MKRLLPIVGARSTRQTIPRRLQGGLLAALTAVGLLAAAPVAGAATVTTDVISDLIGAYNVTFELPAGRRATLAATGFYGDDAIADVTGRGFGGGVDWRRYVGENAPERSGPYVALGFQAESLTGTNAHGDPATAAVLAADAVAGHKSRIGRHFVFDFAYGLALPLAYTYSEYGVPLKNSDLQYADLIGYAGFGVVF